MNSFGSDARPVKWIWRLVLLYALVAPGAAPLCAAPRKDAPKAPPAASSPTPAPDPQDSTAKDLLLTPDNEKKADALAEFIQGDIAEENADTDGAMDAYRKVLAADPAAKVRTEEDSDTLMLLSAKVGFELARSGDPASGIDLLKDAIKASPKDPMAYFFLSQLYGKYLKKNDMALKYAEQALDLDPNNFNFYVANYELLLDLGQVKKAGEILDRASKIQNNDAEYWLQLSELYVHATVKENNPIQPDDLKKMNELFQKTVALAKDDPFVLARVADFDVMTRQTKEAIPLYQKALALKDDPTDPALVGVREKLAGSYIAAGQRDEAIKVLQDLVKINPLNYSTYESLGKLYAEKEDYPDALASFQQLLLLDPKEPRNYLPVMEFMLQLRKFDQAVDLMRDAHRKFPESPRVTYGLARTLSAAKKDQEAMTTFEQAASEAQESDSDMLDGEFYFRYGAAAEQAGLIPKASECFESALTNYQQILQAEPKNWKNYLPVMELMLQLKKYDQAVGLMQDAHRKFPDMPRVTYNLAMALSGAKKNQEAVDTFEEAMNEAKNSDTDMLNGEFYFNYGAAAEQAGLIPKATDLFKKTIALDPDGKTLPNPGAAYNYLGFMWVDRDQNIDEGGDLIRHALQMEPDNAAYIDSLGWYYYKKGQPDQALVQLLKAAETTKPEDSEVDGHIADTYQKLGKIPEALTYWQKALALDPDNKDIAKKIEAAKVKVTSIPAATPEKAPAQQ